MGGTYGMHREMRSAYTILVEKPERKGLLENHMCRWENIPVW
jgi:hypothetical protein